jgi:Family of unknown function (DUF6118)
VREFDSAKVAAVAERRELAAMIGSMRGQRKQMEWLALTGAVALMVGLLPASFAARLLPFGWDAAVAASILHTDRWNAGIALMRSTNPEGWATLVSEMDLIEPNHAALTRCREAAAWLKESQSCVITSHFCHAYRRIYDIAPSQERHATVGDLAGAFRRWHPEFSGTEEAKLAA